MISRRPSVLMNIIERNHQISPRRAESQSDQAFHGSVHSAIAKSRYGFIASSASICTYYHRGNFNAMLVYMGRILGIDYGARRVGVALSDEGHIFAFAKDIYPNDEHLLDALVQLTSKEQVERFVVGESDNPIGGENTIMRRIAIFSKALEVRTGLPVDQVSEAYSTAEARRALESKIKTRKDTNVPVDAAAAAIILQTYLDDKRS